MPTTISTERTGTEERTARHSAKDTVVQLHRDETGAQSMEYAALACGGAGLVGIIIKMLSSPEVLEMLTRIIVSVFEHYSSTLIGLF